MVATDFKLISDPSVSSYLSQSGAYTHMKLRASLTQFLMPWTESRSHPEAAAYVNYLQG